MKFENIGRNAFGLTRRVVVIGSGYVGLTLSACLATLGHHVHCTDRSLDRISRIVTGDLPIVEVGLPALVAEALGSGRLKFGFDNVAAVQDAEFVFLCLPTPEGADGRADLRFVLEVVEEIGSDLLPGAVVITKSTVPVGTSVLIEGALDRSDIHVVSNPEFLAEGSAVQDCLHPDRIVVGARHRSVGESVAQLYGADALEHSLITDLASAELVKYASNAYLATRLTFVNSIADLCEAVGADIRAVAAGMGADSRIGSAFLKPGPGWGGSCFPKDSIALVRTAEEWGCKLELVETAIHVNEQHIQRMVSRAVIALDGDVVNKRVALWGLTFKAGTDDLRQSPAVAIAQHLMDLGVSVHAYDPAVVGAPVPGIFTHTSAYEAVVDADLLIVATEWPEFARVNWVEVATRLRRSVVFDTRNILDSATLEICGITHMGVGISRNSQLESADVDAQ